MIDSSSDTDDTDVLLLIPPDFFLLKSPKISQESLKDTEEKFISNISSCPMSFRNDSYRCLPPKHQLELEHIDDQLTQIESNISRYNISDTIASSGKLINEKFLKQIDSTNSIDKKQSQNEYKMNQELQNTDNTIHEIDNFLKKNLMKRSHLWNRDCVENYNQQCYFKFPESDKFSDTKRNELGKAKTQAEEDDNSLISLNEIWNTNSNFTITKESLPLLKEERLRRQHCEKNIQLLQQKLLECQQKITVAIDVDKTKDEAIQKLQGENNRLQSLHDELNQKLSNLEEEKLMQTKKFKQEFENLESHNKSLEKELSQTLKLLSTFQHKCEILESEIESLKRTSKQIEDIEIKLSICEKNEKIVNKELQKLKLQHEQLKCNYEQASTENASLKTQINQLEQIKNEKCKKYDDLERKYKKIEELYSESMKKENDFLKEFKNQHISLKSHYQQQLENVISEKLKEFQMQLNIIEESIKSEAKERERLIAERFIKQIELINEKNEQEIKLVNEKHREEIELYQMQMVNAMKKISNLEKRINEYRYHKAELAEKLHSVIEMQWKNALEILTDANPNEKEVNDAGNHLDKKERSNNLEKYTKQENKLGNDDFKLSNLHSPNNSQRNVDRLQAYIEMLLNKSPTDLNNLQEILNMPKSQENVQTRKLEVNKSTSNKPPWK